MLRTPEFLRRGSRRPEQPQAQTVEVAETVDPLQEEREKTVSFLTRITELAPPEGSSVFGFTQNSEWYSSTLKDRMKTAPYEMRGSNLLRSMGSLLKEDTRGIFDLMLTKDWHEKLETLTVRGSGDNKLVVYIDHKHNAKARFVANSFSFTPSIGHLERSRWDTSMTPELADQIYANAVLEILATDLEDNRAKWEEQLQQKREGYFKRLEEAIGIDATRVIKHSLERLAVATRGEPYMVFAPDPKSGDGDESSPLILYTTARLTQELSEEFSRTGYGGYYYPTTFQSSNARNAKPIMITPRNGLTVEVRQIESLHGAQEYDLITSLKNFLHGNENATEFTIFPPDRKGTGGVRTTLLATSSASVELERKEETTNP